MKLELYPYLWFVEPQPRIHASPRYGAPTARPRTLTYNWHHTHRIDPLTTPHRRLPPDQTPPEDSPTWPTLPAPLICMTIPMYLMYP